MTKIPSAGSKATVLMAISNGPSFNYTSHKKDAVAGYTLYAFIDNAEATAEHTFFNGQPAYLLDQTTQPKCFGDAAGRGGGVKSGTIGGEVKPTSGSSTIFIEGKALVREGDTCTMNNGNVKGKYVTVDATYAAQIMAQWADQSTEQALADGGLLVGPGGGWDSLGKGMGVQERAERADSLAKWSQSQGHSTLETQRLLSELNAGKQYTGKLRPLLSSDKPRKPVSSEEMYGHYLYGRGQPLTLENLGSAQLLKDSVLKEGAYKRESSVQDRFIKQLAGKFKTGDTDYTFSNAYNVGEEIDVWAYGSSVISGKFNGTIEKNSAGDTRISGKIDYKYTDDFKDPYDTFDNFSGNWDPNGTPYKVTGSWTNYVNKTIKK
ncbi:DUF4150 domain-containing protein [Psychrobacter sp. YGAH215]|uniref:DUF4150 domain-containing protein n=1 Tax=Psychrobacter sp. YGAH215 TaxID=2596826 RepID=UPI0011855248|nr:DUF4150 domain-containing protein [Psychrobacter sp. YGAH215]TSB21709.1 DUF4150 domain-containing protein [Psychrobacter sp. YGAH215]